MNDAEPTDCYDHPRYWDLAFSEDTQAEAEFVAAAYTKYCDFPVQRLVEPGCGGGRLLVELASRGFGVAGFDLSQAAVDYANSQLADKGAPATAFVGDMTNFQVMEPFDAAVNLVNTFRHLTTEKDARRHLECVAEAIRPGGIYILGFHLIPLDADEEDTETWTVSDGDVTVDFSLEVLQFDRKRRIEVVRYALEVNDSGRRFQIQTNYEQRIYLHTEFLSLLASVPAFELCDVFDFWYDIDNPLELNDVMSDAVFVLRRIPTA